MHKNKKNFLRIIEFIKEIGICPSCWTAKRLLKSGMNSYCCSHCEVNYKIERDKIIMEWYVIDDDGRRILRSKKILAGDSEWANLLKYIRDQKVYK